MEVLIGQGEVENDEFTSENFDDVDEEEQFRRVLEASQRCAELEASRAATTEKTKPFFSDNAARSSSASTQFGELARLINWHKDGFLTKTEFQFAKRQYFASLQK